MGMQSRKEEWEGSREHIVGPIHLGKLLAFKDTAAFIPPEDENDVGRECWRVVVSSAASFGPGRPGGPIMSQKRQMARGKSQPGRVKAATGRR